jgi:hypothetical protein
MHGLRLIQLHDLQGFFVVSWAYGATTDGSRSRCMFPRISQRVSDLPSQLLDTFPDSQSSSKLSRALLRLSGKCGLHPTCFALPGLQKVGEQVAGGAFGDIWKGVVKCQSVAVKVMRLFRDVDVNIALMVRMS